MTMSARSLFLCSIAASGMLMLGACGKHDAGSEASPPAASTAATPPAGAPMTPPSPSTTGTPPSPSTTPMPPASAGTSMPAPASTSASVAPAAEAPFAISKVVVGDAVNAAHKVSSPKLSIPAGEKAIYASVETSGKTEGATLSARWSYLEGKSQLVSSISQSIATDGPAITTFKIQNPHNWPAGKYKVDIALDGKPVSSQSFEVTSSS